MSICGCYQSHFHVVVKDYRSCIQGYRKCNNENDFLSHNYITNSNENVDWEVYSNNTDAVFCLLKQYWCCVLSWTSILCKRIHCFKRNIAGYICINCSCYALIIFKMLSSLGWFCIRMGPVFLVWLKFVQILCKVCKWLLIYLLSTLGYKEISNV